METDIKEQIFPLWLGMFVIGRMKNEDIPSLDDLFNSRDSNDQKDIDDSVYQEIREIIRKDKSHG